NIICPGIRKELCKRSILVTEFVEGMKISETLAIKYKSRKKSRPLSLLLRAYILMIFKFKFFHADPHPGNIIYTPEGKLCFIDFGSVGYLEESTESSLRKIMLSAISKDYYGVVDGMEEMGFFKPDVNKEKLEQITRFAFEKLERFIRDTDSFQNISIDELNPNEVSFFLEGINTNLRELLKISQVPPNYIMLERVFALLIGHVAYLDPYRTIFEYAKPPFYSLINVKESKIEQILREDGSELAVDFISLPGDLHKALIKLNRGRITTRNKDTEKQTEKLHYVSRHLVYTILCVAFFHFGNFFFTQNKILPSYTFYTLGGMAGIKLFFSLMKDKLSKL
ncbi:MAG: AarF/UbiB family protein, partial [Spirochaetota bacterium]